MPNDLHPVPTDPSSLAAAGFLARYREPTVSAYRNDLRCYWAWCAQQELQPLRAQRAHLELYLRDLHARGYAPATIGRRLSTVAGLFRYAVIDEVVAKNPTVAVTRPKVQWEGQRRTVLHRWSSPRCSPPRASTATPHMRSSRSSGCSGFA